MNSKCACENPTHPSVAGWIHTTEECSAPDYALKLELAAAAVATKEKEEAFIASLSPEQKKTYIELWAHRLAEDLSRFTD